ncbi:RNA 2'-phosphotransferase [Streptococcus oriscaviae]|uniref:RNA 2'-phosphotransferase n=1 Tax=Streptococcus oriscaviae TaxID=2781599 RepID=UPI0024AF1C0F|nr:RNA 2'-phosphotransferase [Streptococcus oriscaviae]
MIDYGKLSRDCSYILRHAVDKYNLKSDSSGWVSLNDFIAVLNLHFGWCNLSEDALKFMVAKSKKK